MKIHEIPSNYQTYNIDIQLHMSFLGFRDALEFNPYFVFLDKSFTSCSVIAYAPPGGFFF